MRTRVGWWIIAVTAAVLATILSGLYLHRFGCGWLESLRLVLGIMLLWTPVGALVYALLPAAVPHRGCRFALAWGASYALTTLLYFGCAVLGAAFLFYIFQGAALLGALILCLRAQRQPTTPAVPWGGLDFVLIALIALSLILNVRYQIAFKERVVNGETIAEYTLFGDQLYHVGQAYELSRHIPPQQAMIRGGSPERAYHNFSHITTMLLARYTGQRDMLRAHVFYHYAVIDILFCLCLFGIGRTITGANWPGYASVLFMYIVVPDGPVLTANNLSCFYFTLFPHGSSGLSPVAGTSPQMYSGLSVLFAILLGVTLFCQARVTGRPIGWLACVLTLMTVATLRFRIHIFLVLFPMCLLGLAVLWYRTRSAVPPILAVLAVLLSGLLYKEMQGRAYLPQTARLYIGYNSLTADGWWMNFWPLATEAHNLVNYCTDDPTLRQWLWQVVSMTGFSLFNVVGVPLLIGTVIALLSKRMRQEFGWLLFATVAMTVSSIVAGVLLTTDYDPYSVGGQLLLHTHWYLFALLPMPLWLIYRHLRDRWDVPAWSLGPVALLAVALMLYRPLQGLILNAHDTPRTWWINDAFTLNSDERQAFAYLHDHAPDNAIILTDRAIQMPRFAVSGLTGHAAYLESVPNPVDAWAMSLDSDDNRLKRIHDIWSQHDPEQFEESLRQTHATILLEYADSPLAVEGGRPGLTLEWTSPNDFVKIYRIDH